MSNLVTATRPVRTGPRLKLVVTPQADSAISQCCPYLEASEAAAAIGIDPRKPQRDLWHCKTLQIPHTGKPEECDATTATNARYWRNLLEPLVASVYTKRSGNALRRINQLACHPDHPWMQARMEWEVVGNPGVNLMRYVNVGGQEAEDWSQGLPMHERVNALHLLAVTGKQAVDLAVLICGRELKIYTVRRDEPLIERVMKLEFLFWRCVDRNEPLPSEGLRSPIVLRSAQD
ncbi:MAG: YqaJ viral recombinase family protein [Burkholderiaceae bacterium]|nr:YqaJ viral recombinase family protein [Polaromonas sp.]MDO8767244.1 YqaJ viral recombinase family protein [Burkholderiaceae bacterium]